MRHRTWAVGLVAAAVIVASARSASADQYKSGSYFKQSGNDKIGGSFHAVGILSSTPKSAFTYGSLSARVRLFGKSREAIGATYCSWSNAVTGNANLVVRLAGYQVYTKKLSESWSKSWNYSGTIVEGTYTFSVYGVPVAIWGRIGGGFRGDLSLIATPTAAGIEGSVNAWLCGAGGGGVGWSWIKVGIEITIDLLDTTLSAQMKADFLAVNGLVKLSLLPIRLSLAALVNTTWKDFRWTLFEWSSPRYEWILFQA